MKTAIATITLSLILAACGGGGTSSDDPKVQAEVLVSAQRDIYDDINASSGAQRAALVDEFNANVSTINALTPTPYCPAMPYTSQHAECVDEWRLMTTALV